MRDRLRRLLGACEALTRGETAALAGGNLAVLGTTQQVKSAILADLAAEANLVHASCDSSARTRLERLLECNRENARRLSRMKAEATGKMQKIRAAAGQLQTLRTAYAPGRASRRQALCTHG